MRKTAVRTLALLCVLILGVAYYTQTHVSIWGFNIPKSTLQSVTIFTDTARYSVHDPKVVAQIAEQISSFKKYKKVEVSGYPPEASMKPFRKLLIQTTDGTYGGSLWNNNDDIIQDGNGYYWLVPDQFFDLLKEVVRNPTITKI